jgi:hypothetical protein
MDTASNIKFNVEGDDKFSQFLEKTQKSFKELNEKSLKFFNTGLKDGTKNLKDITKQFQNKRSIVDSLVKDYGKATVATTDWNASMGKLVKTTSLLGGALNALNIASIGTGIVKTVGTGVSEILNAVTMTSAGINAMAASGFDGTPLMNSLGEITSVLTGNTQAIEAFSARSTAAFNQFEQKLNEVNIVFGLSQERLSEYGKALQDGLEKNLKNSVSSLTALNAAYQAASAGFTEFQQNQDVVNLAIKANKAAPGSDLFQIGGAIGKGAGILETKDIAELEEVTAKWLATEQQGLTTVGDMTEYISDMYSSLKNAGIGTKDLVNETQGLVVAFTKLGGKVTDISTEMQAFARNTIGKTPEAMKALEGLVDAQGKAITLNQEYFGRKGVVQGIVDFAEAVGYNTEKIKEVYNETNAFNFAMKVLAQNGNLAKKSIEDISAVTSENLTEAFDSATSSSQAKMEQITNAYDEIMISFGKAFQQRTEEGVKSVEWYKEVLVKFKEPLVEIAERMVNFYDGLNKVTGTLGALAKMIFGITGTIISFRAWGLVLGGITNGFKDLRKEGSVIKELYQSNQGLLAIGKQVLGLDQQKLLSQNRINEAIKNSTTLEKELAGSIGKSTDDRLNNIEVIKQEIDSIVARDQSIIKGQQNVNKVEESFQKKTEKRDAQRAEVGSTSKTLANLKTLRQDIENSLIDNEENIKRSGRLQEIAAQESLIRQGDIGKEERKQLKDLNTEKLRLQDTYNKTTLDQLNSLQKQREILNNKANKSERDNQALANITTREKQLIDREKNKDRTPLTDEQKGTLTNTRNNLSARITQEELVLLTQRQKLQEANNLVDKETEKLNKARADQTEKLNRVTKTTTELAVLQQDLNTKKNTLDRVNIAFEGQQQKLYTIQNALRKEQTTLDKIRNKDSVEYLQQQKKVLTLQVEEAKQLSTVQKARTTQQTAQQTYNKAEFESKRKSIQLTREQGLAEGTLIEMRTRSGSVALKNTAFNRALIATNEGFANSIKALQSPTQSFGNIQDTLSNKMIDLKANMSQLGVTASRSFTGMATSAKASFAAIGTSAALMGETLKAAFISTGIGLLIGAVIGLGAKLIQVGQESAKLDKTYKDFNTTLEESATKFDRANISFDNSVQGLNKFSDRLEASKKLMNEVDSTVFDDIGNSIKGAVGGFVDFVKTATGLSALDPLFANIGERISAIWTSFSDAEFIKRSAKMTQISDFIQTYELALRGQNKELEKGNLLTETSNQKIRARMILTGEDLEREKAANTTRIESFQSMTDIQKKELDELKGKGDKLNERDKQQIALLESEISRREKVIEVSKKQFEDQLKYYEARNLLLDRENKFSNSQVSLEEIKSLQNQVNSSQTALNANISEGLDIYSNSIKDSSIKSKQLLSDLKDGSLSVKATLKGLGGEIYKVDQDGKVLSKLPDTVLKSIETVLKGKEIDGKKYTLEQVLGLKETRDALTEAGVEIPKDLSVLADKMRKSYEESEGQIKLINLKDLEKDLADFSVLSDKYQEKKRAFLSTTKGDVGATQFSTSLKKSLRLAETDLQSFLNALDSSSKGLNTYVTSSTEKFTKQALDGTLDLTEGLKELGQVESEIKTEQLEKLKTAITGKNKDQILAALKEIGVETEKALTADSIDFNKFEENLGMYVESLNAVAESGEATSEEIAKKFENVYNQMKGRVTPAAYKDLTETLIGYEKAASEQRISYIGMETSALEQQKKYGFLLETDYIEQINKLNIQTTEENIKSKKVELVRLLTLYKESAPQVVKAKAELESLELNLSNQKSNNPVEIAKAQSKERFDNLKKELELGNITKRQYIDEELKDSKLLYQIQLAEKQKMLTELMKDEVKNAKAIKALRKSMESDERDFNLNLLEINRRRIEEQFKLQTNALGKRELEARENAINGTTKEELESVRKLETDKIALNIKTLESRLAVEKKGSEKFLEIEKQLLEAQLSLREVQVKQSKDRSNEEIERKKNELSTIAALEERNNIQGSTNKSLEATRQLREKEVQLNIDSINSQIALTEKGSKERLVLEQQLILEVNKLQKTQFDNQKERLEQSLEDRRKQLEAKQIDLEKNSIRGTTNEDIEASRKLKEEEISSTIETLKQRSNLYREGSKERIALEQEIVKETLKLDKQIYENQKSRLQTQIDNRKKAFKDNQLQLEKLMVLGTSAEDSKKVRASKEEEIQITIEGIKKEINLTKAGSTQRKDLERALREELLKLDKQRIANKRELIDEEITLEKTKITKIQSLLERSTINGTFEKDLDKLRELKVKETQIVIQSIQKQLATYKLGSKERLQLEAQLTQEVTKLQKIQFSNRKEKLESQLEDAKNKLDKQVALKEAALINGATEQELKIVEETKIKETQLTINSIKKQMALYKAGSKERLALEANLQREINNLRKQTLDKEKNLIQTNLEFKKTKIDINNIELEKKLLRGDIDRESFEDKLTTSSQKVNLLQQEAFTKQLKLYQKGSREYLTILKDLSQLQVDYQKSVVDKAIRDIDRITKSQNNSIEAQKQSITRQLSSSDDLTKELQEQIKLEDSRSSVIKATSDYQIGLLELTKRSTGDVEKRAKIDVQIAEMKQKSLIESQQLEINSIKNNALINEAALERERIQISLNKLELDRSKLQTEAELRKAKLNKLDSAAIEALQLQLNSINDQYDALGRSENLISTQISNQAEISNNQLKVVKQQQDLAQKNSALDVEQAKQGLIIAGYEKQLSQLKMKGTLIEANANKEKVIGDLLTKAYDTQIALLNSRKELMDSTLSSIDTLYGIEQSMAKSDLTKDKLAREQAQDRLNFLELQQRMENESFNLEKAKNKIVRERQKVELTIAGINAKQALAMSKAEEARTNARKDATDEEKLAARLAVESAEQGILAAKANKELAIEISKIEEQSEKNKEIINARNQRNQRLQAEMAVAQTTSNTADDSQIRGKAQRYRELDERSIGTNNLTNTTNRQVDNILKEFTESMRLRKPIDMKDISNVTKAQDLNLTPKNTISPTNIPSIGGLGKGSTSSATNESSNGTKKDSKDNMFTSINNLGKSIDKAEKSITKKLGLDTQSLIKTYNTNSKSLNKLIEVSVKNISKSITSATNTITGTTLKGKKVIEPPRPKKGEIVPDSLRTIREAITNFKLSVDKANIAKKKEADIRYKEEQKDNDKLQKSIEQLIDKIEEHIQKGGNNTINAPMTINSKDAKETGASFQKYLYDVVTKVQQRQK